jgi:rhodanese-related sulfurtransferase
MAVTSERVGLVEVEPADLRAMLGRGEALVVDVREPDEFAREHIEGALLIPLSRLHPAQIPADDGRVVVLHCRSGSRSTRAANLLLGSGRGTVRHLKGGLAAWRAAGLPVVEDRRVPISIMRQVQIAAGSLVVLGTVLGAWVSPWFLVLSGFVGAGLVFAGATGTCGMAALLGLMPWNRAVRGGGAGQSSAG